MNRLIRALVLLVLLSPVAEPAAQRSSSTAAQDTIAPFRIQYLTLCFGLEGEVGAHPLSRRDSRRRLGVWGRISRTKEPW